MKHRQRLRYLRDHEGNGRVKFGRRALNAGVDVADPRGLGSRPERVAGRAGIGKGTGAGHLETLARLPERQRTVFLLRFVEDLDLLEIGAITGMKEGTAKTHLFRALQPVRARLEEQK